MSFKPCIYEKNVTTQCGSLAKVLMPLGVSYWSFPSQMFCCDEEVHLLSLGNLKAEAFKYPYCGTFAVYSKGIKR